MDCLGRRFPKLSTSFKLLSENLISNDVLELPKAIAEQAQNIVSAFWRLREHPDYQRLVFSKGPYSAVQAPGNSAALCSFDFHISETGQLKLIEINTNASMGLVAHFLYLSQSIQNPFAKPDGNGFEADVLDSFRNETFLAVQRPLNKLRIVDDHPSQQKLYIEFLLYQALFEEQGLECDIADVREPVPPNIDCVYNRHTDFYLNQSESQNLRASYLSRQVAVTPHPTEYQLVADKERLVDICRDGFWETISLDRSDQLTLNSTVLLSRRMSDWVDQQDLWSKRKQYVFKPLQLFGGKAVYRGTSITRGTFETLPAESYMVQEYVPAPTRTTDSGETFKYDLRFITYQDQIQIAFARLYQGQVTGFSQPGGGIAPIKWI